MNSTIEELVQSLTLEEKAGLCSGRDFWRTKAVLQNGRPVDLTPNEFLLLEQLMRNRGAALYRDTLYERVWGGDRAESDTRTLDLHIMRLRRKLHWYDHIETVYRIGYRLKKEES